MTSVPSSPASGGLEWAHPLVRNWFLARFRSPTEPQIEGWPHIVAGRTVLISAPTGSGKTLAAFLAAIDRLVRQALAGTLADRTEVVYVSPLRALSNDIEKNLQTPLAEILALAERRGLAMPPIRTAVRTGDTLQPERRRMIQRPPHILVTTPESLYILLTAERSRRMLATAETVIVDEIHAVADDKRGAHLALSLERLEALAGRPLVRVGLSATQKPIERLAQFLSGAGRPTPAVVEIGRRRALDLAVEVPRSELGPVAPNELWDEIYDRIAQLAAEQRSTLVFVNTRRLAERVAYHLAERMGKESVAAHHGSLARKLRLEAERRLKAGELRALVATASLELGIDIGAIDLVCQIGSPRSIAVALQRIGRSGHWRGAVPRGRLFATTRDELVECAALVRAMHAGQLDAIEVPEAPLDVLAQQIVAACATREWREDELFHLARRADPYRRLARRDFDAVVEMLSEGIAARRGRLGAWLHRDRVNGRLRGRRGARLAAPSTRISPWKASAAISSCWAIAAGRFVAWKRGGCSSPTPTARRPMSPSGAARRPGVPPSSPSRWRNCDSRSPGASRPAPTRANQPRRTRQSNGSAVSAASAGPVPNRPSNISSPVAPRSAPCPRGKPSSPNDSSTRAAGCSW